MSQWPDRRILDLLGIELPILQAPMAGPGRPELAIAVCEAGGLGSLPCAQLGVEQVQSGVEILRRGTRRPINLNFFCHTPPAADAARERAWRERLAPYYREFGLDPAAVPAGAARQPFDERYCAVVEACRPEVVSFHFGLPAGPLLARVKAVGAKVIASATTVAEARWLQARGVDAVIAMGLEAGGHRGNFLGEDMARQVGTFALVPQIADAVRVPVIAAGGIADGRGIAAAFALGACAVQIGTAYLFCPETRTPPWHRQALKDAADEDTVITNVFTGRPARGIVNRVIREVGPMAAQTPPFPTAAAALAPLKARSEAAGSGEFSNLWSGQAARLCREMPAGRLTRLLAEEALAKFK